MSGTEKILVFGVFMSIAWLIWNGRANSPRKRRDRARWDYLLEQAVRDNASDEKR